MTSAVSAMQDMTLRRFTWLFFAAGAPSLVRGEAGLLLFREEGGFGERVPRVAGDIGMEAAKRADCLCGVNTRSESKPPLAA